MTIGRDIPGLNLRRLVDLMSAAVERCRLDLSSYVVFTEAASQAYVVTPILAAMAGAKQVYATTRSTRHGTFDEVAANTRHIAKLAGVGNTIEILDGKPRQAIAAADIVTNSGHVRPIDAEMISWMKRGAVIPLMYETWELRETDIDIAACRKHGIRLTGTNERHPAVDVFSYLGVMAVKLLHDAAVAVYQSRILLICDNDFGPFIERGLGSAGAAVDRVTQLQQARPDAPYDAILVSRTPTAEPALSLQDIAFIAKHWPGAPLVVYWGDVSRQALRDANLSFWPPEAPHAGHMGILPSGVGPEAIVRLQSGSLKAAEALLRHPDDPQHPDRAFSQPL